MARTGTKSVSALLATVSFLAMAPAAWAQDADAPAVEPQVPEEREVIVVRGANIPEEKRDTSEISSVVDSADFSATGAGDAADALLRVTGVSLQRGRFVVVRGLNERYSSATLNGSPLPSPEPLRRVAPLDLFPTNILESVLVQKTYSPNYSLEFGGGIVDLRTLTLPSSRFFDVQLSAGANTEVSFQEDALLHDGGDQDWTGFDDGTRNLPPSLAPSFENSDFPADSATRQQLAADIADPSLWVVQRGFVGPNMGFEASGGDIIDLSPALSLGVIGTVGYDNAWSARDGFRDDRTISGSSNQFFDREQVANEIKSNALLSLGLDIYDEHQLKFTALGARSTEKRTESRTNLSDPSFDGARRDSTSWFERQTWLTQVAGSHDFPNFFDISVDWRASYSEAFRDVPFSTEVTYEDQEDLVVTDPSRDLRLSFDKLEDDAQDIGIDVELPILWGPLDVIVKGGWTYREQNRETLRRDYFFRGASRVNQDSRIDVRIPADGFELELFDNAAEVPEAFRGALELDAFYLFGDFQLGPYVRASIGGRYEDSLQTIDPFSRSVNVDVPDAVDRLISSEYFLPAATITWNPFTDQQVRLGYSETIVRPQFRELSPQVFFNDLTDLLSRGNPGVTGSELTNVDLRYEWYFGRDEFFTAGLFYKEIEAPIVEIDNTAFDSQITTFANLPAAEIQGAEVEFEKAFDLSNRFDVAWLSTKDIILNINYTFSDSKVDVDGTSLIYVPNSTPGFQPETELLEVAASNLVDSGSRLQGQSEHLFNLQFGFDDFQARSQARILVNYASDRIQFYRNVDGSRLDTLENPPFTVDLRYSRAFDVLEREFEVAFTARNIFEDNAESVRETEQGEFIFDTYELGQTFSVSLTGRF